MKTIHLEQGESAWLQWRAVGLGSSDCAVLMNGSHFGVTVEKLFWEKVAAVHGLRSVPTEKTPKKKFQNAAMSRGRDLEPSIREWYHQWTGILAQPCCARHATYEWMKASFDGWCGKNKVVLEIKAPGVKKDGTSDHYTALEGKVPDKYIPQLTHLCLVTGENSVRVHYVSHGDENIFSSLDLNTIVEWFPSKEIQEELLEKEIKFWECVEKVVPPTED